MSRFNAKLRGNYYPLPAAESERIRNLLRFPSEMFSALDPCVGEGLAFEAILKGAMARRYGIELDAYRAEQAASSLNTIVQGNCLETHCPVESFSCIYLNPPYDWAFASDTPERLESVFLNHTFRWLMSGGVLLLVIPAGRAADCSQILASHFKMVRTFRLSDPQAVRYRQVLIAGVRRTRRERDKLRDREIREARARFAGLGRVYDQLAPPRKSLHKSRIAGRVIKSLPEPLYSRVQAVFKIPVGFGGPEPLAQLIARNQLAGILEKAEKNLYGLPLKPDFAALLPEFSRTHVELEDAEPEGSRGRYHWSHSV